LKLEAIHKSWARLDLQRKLRNSNQQISTERKNDDFSLLHDLNEKIKEIPQSGFFSIEEICV